MDSFTCIGNGLGSSTVTISDNTVSNFAGIGACLGSSGLQGIYYPQTTSVIVERPAAAWLVENYLTPDERDKLSPAARLALSSGSTADEYLNELRLLIGARFV